MPRLIMHRATVENASVLKRILAFAVDLIVINLVIAFPFQGLLRKMLPVTDIASTYKYVSSVALPTMFYVVVFCISLVVILYFVLLEKKVGQSIGKIIFNLHVASPDNSSWRFWLRSLFLIPVFPFVLLWMIDPVYMLFNDQHQRLTEYLGKTRVVEKISW